MNTIKFCAKCGAPIGPEEKFCGGCGASIAEMEAEAGSTCSGTRSAGSACTAAGSSV